WFFESEQRSDFLHGPHCEGYQVDLPGSLGFHVGPSFRACWSFNSIWMGDFVCFECGLQMLSTCRQVDLDRVVVHLLVCLLLLDLFGTHSTAYRRFRPSFSFRHVVQGQVGGGSEPTLMARSSHGALRRYDDGRGRCGGPSCEFGGWYDGSSHTGWLLWCGNKDLLRVHGGERRWSCHVDCGIVGGVALGSHGLSHR
ncbi:unnamed protein product, partial [Prunus brigantina]